jgi:hypothetical protein
MPRREKIYRQLPGRGITVFQLSRIVTDRTSRWRPRERLFQGPDHILQVAFIGFIESYKRFYYRDIQAITIRKTHLGKIWNGVCGFFIATFALPAFNMPTDAAIGMWSVSGVFGIFLLFNLLAGPTSACHIRTAVQVDLLAGVTRIRTARKLVRRIRPVIDAAQGSVSREELLHLRPMPATTTGYAGDLPPIISEAESETAPAVPSETPPTPFG